MKHPTLKLLFTLALTLCALALCGCVMAESVRYSVNIANFDSQVMPYCSTIELSANSGGTEVNSSAIGAMENETVSIRIVPNANCSVGSIAYTYQDYGSTQRVACVTGTDASGAVTASFRMPPANVTLEITMAADGAILHDVSFTGDKCDHGLLTSSGGQSGIAIQAAAGETITVRAVPHPGYDLIDMSYTTRSNPVSVPLACSRGEDGSFTAELVMPDEPLYITADGGKTAIPYISYNTSGVSQGERTCEDYQLLTNSSATWYDVNDNDGGWYVVRGNVTLSANTTLRVTGSVHLILCDGAKLTAGDGVYIKKGSSLSIYGQSAGTGKLVAKPDSGPGIGGMANTVGGSLYIHGGVIDAKGGTNAAGIGGGNHESGYQNIVIYGGSVTAQGGSSGAGIGKGQQNSPSACGPIAIYGGTVNATGGDYGAGIGGGEDRDGGSIRIYGGTVKAQGGHDGAGIGGGEDGSGGDIVISGGSVTATGGNNGAGIGGGENANSGTIVIYDGIINASSPYFGAGIGGGEEGHIDSVTIHGGTVTAQGGEGAAGIGASGGNAHIIQPAYDQGGPVIIKGGTVTAKGGLCGAGIGGAGDGGDGGRVEISGGTVTAEGGKDSAGIGGASHNNNNSDGDGGNVSVSGGTVFAIGGEHAAGIGGSACGKGGTFTISGGEVHATGWFDAAAIGGGYDRDGGQVNISGGSVEVTFRGGTASSERLCSHLIGRGSNETEHYSDKKEPRADGSLFIADGLSVYAESDETLIPAAERKNACQQHLARLTIFSCTEHEASAAFDITDETHTGRCLYCNGLMEEENHIYEDGICGVCGYAGALVTIHYLPGNDDATGTMPDETCLPNGVYLLADCRFAYDGYDFNGWRLGDTETILPAGTEQRFEAETTLTATWRNNWSELQAAINAAESGTVIRLDGDTVASVYDSSIKIPAGKSITLDLNGCRLNRALTASKPYGQVIENSGTLTITDSVGGGVITGGNSAKEFDGGGITNSGTLILEGGTITGNQAASSAGAVRNAAGATFTMTGGAISGNTCGGGGGGGVVNYGTMTLSGGEITGNVSGQNGGGIWNKGTLHLNGGTITGNTANDKGAGIYARGESTLTLSGLTVITDNSSNQLGSNDLHINQDGKLPAITLGDLAEDSRIGVSCSVAPTATAPVAIIAGVTGEVPQIFSNSNKYILSYSSGDGKLYLAVAQTHTVTVSAGMAHGTVTADPANCNAGDTVTLTAEAEENYILESLTVTPEGGEAQAILPDAETGAYRFTMPAANVTVNAGFIQDKTSAAVQLVWNDDSSASRPDTVYATLLDLGEPVRAVELTAAANWTNTLTGLPLDHNGELASYTFTIGDSYLPAGYSLTGSAVDGELTTLTLTPAQPVTIAQSENGTVTAGKREAAVGETVTLTVTPEPGYRLQTLTCTAGGEALDLAFDEAAGTYSFIMPAQTVTVTAGFEKIPTDWELLQALIDAAPEGGTVTLAQDHIGTAEDTSLHVVSGQKVTIDLNGFDIRGGTFEGRIFTVNGGELTVKGSGAITGGQSANSVGGAFIVQGGGKLTLNGGSVYGNSANNGGGVAVTNGTFTMNGGEISHNSAAGNGGGVQVQGGTFIMNGGEISVNDAAGNGGGLWVGEGSTVRVTGGTITNNDASLGYDVYLNGTGMAVSGGPAIGQAYVYNTVITVDGALDAGARIGLTCSNSAARNGTVLTSGLNGNGSLVHFTSAKNGYAAALNAAGEVYLGAARTVMLDLNDGSGETREIRVADGTALAEPAAPVRAGYIFVAWQLNGADYDFGTPVTADITLTAQWQEAPPFGIPDFTLPAGVTAVEDSAFEGAAMTVVTIPAGCASIGDYAFKGCQNLTQIRIPAGCALGTDVFSGCGTVYVFAPADSAAEAYCQSHGNCVFVPIE